MSRLLLLWLCATTRSGLPNRILPARANSAGLPCRISSQAAELTATVLRLRRLPRSAEEETIGWFDPRLNGGRLLDVSGLHRVGNGSPTLSERAVHDEEVWRAAECHHLWYIGPVRPHRRGLPRLRKVRCFIAYGIGALLFITRIARSLGYSEECLGMHMGHLHDANLGDGNGRTTELFLARQYYFPRVGDMLGEPCRCSTLTLFALFWTHTDLMARRRASFPGMETERNDGK